MTTGRRRQQHLKPMNFGGVTCHQHDRDHTTAKTCRSGIGPVVAEDDRWARVIRLAAADGIRVDPSLSRVLGSAAYARRVANPLTATAAQFSLRMRPTRQYPLSTDLRSASYRLRQGRAG